MEKLLDTAKALTLVLLVIAVVAGMVSFGYLVWKARYDACRMAGSGPVICFFAAGGR